MRKGSSKIIIAVVTVIVCVGIVFGGILAASRYVHRDELTTTTQSEQQTQQQNGSAGVQPATERVTTVTSHTVQFGDGSLFSDEAKNNILTPEEARANQASGGGAQQQGGGTNAKTQQSGGKTAAQGGGSGNSGGGAASAPYALSSSDKATVLNYYKKISGLNASKLFHKSLKLVSMDGGATVKQSWVDNFRGMAERGLAKNNIDNEPYPGKPNQIMTSDWQSASAVNDGRYTTLTIRVVPQTDNANGTQFGGPCGRSIGVLDGMQRALQDLPLVSVDSMDMTISYQNPTIRVKVDNQTGQLVKGGCSWSYRTVIHINSLTGKAIVNIRLENAGGVIDYKVSY